MGLPHHCVVPEYSLDGPTSPNWFVMSAADGASFEAGYEAECDAATDAGHDFAEATDGTG